MIAKTLPKAPRPASPDTIPLELRQLDRWVCWRYIEKGDQKPAKVPIRKGTNYGVNYNDPKNWRTFNSVWAEAEERDGVGIGFVFSEDDDILGVDLDGCFDADGELTDWGAEVVQHFGHTLSELTPSGNGLHFIGKAPAFRGSTKSELEHGGAVERYCKNRWFTFTGEKPIDFGGDEIADIASAMDWLASRFFDRKPDVANGKATKKPPATHYEDDHAYNVEKARLCLELLSAARFTEGDEWRSVGYALKATGEELAEDWVRWSRQWEDAEEAVIRDRWARFDPQGLTLASLVKWASDDSGLSASEINRQARERTGRLADNGHPASSDAFNPTTAETDTLPRLMLQPFSEVEAREIDWLWPMRIVRGGLTILTGAVGQTKSMLTIDLAARVSLGSHHPDRSGLCPCGDVLMFGHEDAIHEVVKPRLVAAGADCSRVFYVHGKARDPECTDPDEAERVLFGEDIEALRRTLKQHSGIKLLIFDPLPEFIRGDHNAAAEVREALMPLSRLAQEFGVAIVAVCHQNKKTGLSAVQSIAGSGGFVQVARTVLAVVNDPDDTETGFTRRRLMVVAKSNYGGTNEAQAYRLVDRGEGRAAIEWIPGVVEVDADAVVRGGGKGGDGRKTADLDAAVALVREIMGRSAGVTPAREAEEEMKRAGHSRNTMKEAKRIAGVRSRKSGMADGWVWEWDGKSSPVSGEPVPLDEWAANF